MPQRGQNISLNLFPDSAWGGPGPTPSGTFLRHSCRWILVSSETASSELPERPLIKRHQGQLSHSRAGRIYGPKSFTHTAAAWLPAAHQGKPLWSLRVIKRSVSFSKPAPFSQVLRWFCDKNIMKNDARSRDKAAWVNPASEEDTWREAGRKSPPLSASKCRGRRKRNHLPRPRLPCNSFQ